MTEHVCSRARHIRARRLEGLPYRQIVADEDAPLIAALLTENIQRLEAAGTRFRQAEAHALHEEGMTMEEIGRLFGLTRQRISALIRAAAAPPPDQAGDHDDPLPATAAAPDLPGRRESPVHDRDAVPVRREVALTRVPSPPRSRTARTGAR